MVTRAANASRTAALRDAAPLLKKSSRALRELLGTPERPGTPEGELLGTPEGLNDVFARLDSLAGEAEMRAIAIECGEVRGIESDTGLQTGLGHTAVRRLLPYANELRERLVATDITPSVTVLAASSAALASRLTAAWQRAVGVVEQLCGVLEAEDRSLRAVLSLATCNEHDSRCDAHRRDLRLLIM